MSDPGCAYLPHDRDATGGGASGGWTSASDGTLEERRYHCQNWRADVVALIRQDGQPVEWVRYSSYGEPTAYPLADFNRDGVVNSADETAFNAEFGAAGTAGALTADLDFSGTVDTDDFDRFSESHAAFTGRSGVGVQSHIGNRLGYAGYQWDHAARLSHVRHRVYRPDLGRWMTRDPLGYVDGASVYEYVASWPVTLMDAFGLQPVPVPQQVPSVPARPLRIVVPPNWPDRDLPRPWPNSPRPNRTRWTEPSHPLLPYPGWTPEDSRKLPKPDERCEPSISDPSKDHAPARSRWSKRDCNRTTGLAPLEAAKDAVCNEFDLDVDPCEAMRGKSLEACRKAVQLEACAQARQNVVDWHLACDPRDKNGQYSKEDAQRHAGHTEAIATYKSYASGCWAKCDGDAYQKEIERIREQQEFNPLDPFGPLR